MKSIDLDFLSYFIFFSIYFHIFLFIEIRVRVSHMTQEERCHTICKTHVDYKAYTWLFRVG